MTLIVVAENMSLSNRLTNSLHRTKNQILNSQIPQISLLGNYFIPKNISPINVKTLQLSVPVK